MSRDPHLQGFCCRAGSDVFPGPCPWHGDPPLDLVAMVPRSVADARIAELRNYAERLRRKGSHEAQWVAVDLRRMVERWAGTNEETG